MKVDRRTFVKAGLGASAAIFAAPRSLAQSDAIAAYLSDLHAAAKKEGEVSWYIAHWGVDLAERVAAAFGETYPGVRCNVVRATSQVIYQRLSQDFKAKVTNCDVFGSADNGHYVTLKEDKQLLAYEAKNLAACAPFLRNYDPSHHVTITTSNPTVLAYNTRLVKAADAPKKWTDLLDPKWMGQIALPHPGYSGAMGSWALAMNNMYGWDFFEKLKKNKPLIGRSLADPPVQIAAGERKVGLSTAGTAAALQAGGKDVAPVYPEDGTLLSLGMTAIIAGTRHPNAAKLFMEFLLSRKAGDLVTSEYTIPVREDVQPKPGIAKFGALKGIRNDPQELAAKLPDLIEKWRDTFGV